ncbi:hypothetical protein [uncultured Amphritea sp.]|uniref:rolling circle replication-associated protein n=1 Tax=uncultured Amphritea sp. TaxID=981605 RepID=UPI0026075368|nr:hypothetical protein [uncultured Amphritea sp.]
MPVNLEIPITRPVSGFSLSSQDQTNPRYVPWSSDRVKSSIDKEAFSRLWAVMDSINNPVAAPFRSAISEAERNRLVEAAKCPTPEEMAKLEVFRAARKEQNRKTSEAQQLAQLLGVDDVISKKRDLLPDNFGEVVNFGGCNVQLDDLMTTGELVPVERKSEGTAGQAYTVITHRDWSEEYRIRTQVDQCHAIPPEQEGERITNTLSMGGATKIADSCQYMHLKKGGYKTFLTLTVEPEQRKKLESGEITIQKEIGRFWDAMNKIRQRGFLYTAPGGVKRRIKGVVGRNILYCWVVENPLNQDGERNPHIHVLMDWGVPYGPKNSAGIGCIFDAWAKRVEKVWGHGFATLEKMKDTENAGAYLAKAAGYLSKANGESDQGPVKGNRYGISRDSRAPEWVQVGRYEMGIMGSLIADTHDYFSALYGGHFAKRAQLKKALDATPKANKKQRFKIGQTLGKVRKALNRLPAIASKYQLMIKGKERFEEFKAWATSQEMQPGNTWLPPKAEGDAWSPENPRPDSNWFKEFQFRMFAKRAARRFWGMPLSVYRQCIELVGDREQEQYEIFNSWVQYGGLESESIEKTGG